VEMVGATTKEECESLEACFLPNGEIELLTKVRTHLFQSE